MLRRQDIDLWLRWLQDVRRLRGATLDAYGSSVGHFHSWLETHHPHLLVWDDVTAEQVEGFITRPRGRGVTAPSAATQQRDRVVIAQFYKWLNAKHLAGSDPTFDVPRVKVSNRQPKAISDHVWRQLWLSDMADEDRVWLGLGCFTGLRRHEIVSIAPGQVDVERGLIYGLSRKGGTEDTIEFADAARILHERLPQVLPDVDEWLLMLARQARFRKGERVLITLDTPATAKARARASFTDPLLPEPSVLNRQLERLLKRAGMPADLFAPHSLRHTCATNLLRCGIPIEVVADILGHSDISITQRYLKTSGRLAEWRSKIGYQSEIRTSRPT